MADAAGVLVTVPIMFLALNSRSPSRGESAAESSSLMTAEGEDG